MENNQSTSGSRFVPLRVTFEPAPGFGSVDASEKATKPAPRTNDLAASIPVFEPKRVTIEEYRRLRQVDAAEEAAKAVQREMLELRQQAGFYKSLWERSKLRISELEAELASAQAQLETQKYLPWKMSEEKRKEWSMEKEKTPEESQ